MWFFSSPRIIFGEDALDHLDELSGQRAFIVTDPVLDGLGFTERIRRHLHAAGMEVEVFAEVEPDPSLQTVRRGVEQIAAFQPDWIVGLGGGSSLDAAKGMWALYERPDLEPEEISPVFDLNLHKCKLVAIPTTSGTGSEATMYVVLSDLEQRRKISVGNRELIPTLSLIDPSLTSQLPPRVTADTGLDALTHALEAYASTFRNDYSDALALKAAELVFCYLPRTYENGTSDSEAREKMSNAATLGGLAFSNSLVGMAHALGHSFGGYFKVPHGRAVSLFLPYVMEYTANAGGSRYGEIARHLRLTDSDDEQSGARILIDATRGLEERVGQPTSIAALGISPARLEEALETLCAHALSDSAILAAPRMPAGDELERLFLYAMEGKSVDF
ncbi:MAG: iron-containing alcohol dehydrogenase [Caldilineaceae bacterium]|nr:iron-containing alcohol dehydrogenase [Caldilineaceae bacterium]